MNKRLPNRNKPKINISEESIMKTQPYILVTGLLFIVGNFTQACAVENKHAIEAEQHLEQAVESGKSGDTKGQAGHVEDAEKHLIQENKEHPYPQSTKHITGEDPKAEHDKAAFADMEKAKADAKQGHAKQASDDAKNAEAHIKDKEHSK
jgi:hypothetical protein